MSKFGRYRDRTQAAAVQVALHHLLVGRSWRVGGASTRRRLARTGHSAAIRYLALTMVKQSARYAGPYRLAVSTSTPTVGASARVRVQIRSRAGKPIKKLPVAISYAGSSTSRRITDATGTAVATFARPGAGEHDVTVAVAKVPATILRLRKPARGSRVALAGGKTVMTRNRTAVVRALPHVAIKSDKTVFDPGAPLRGRFTVTKSLGTFSRSAEVTLHGPFTNWSQASCATRPRARVIRPVVGNTWKYLAAATPPRGLYVWKVRLSGDRLNAPVTACGGATSVRGTPIAVVKALRSRYRVGARPAADLVTRKLYHYNEVATVRLYGPFAARDRVACGVRKEVHAIQVRVTANGTVRSPGVRVTARGWYGWRATLPGDARHLSVRTACAAPSSIFEVR
ncbi:hypothetical protein ASD30_25535 [Nocardioides sp. Root140]|nr:hypothetical protein ASD30_25535 [Nocardioides sp. Root140]